LRKDVARGVLGQGSGEPRVVLRAGFVRQLAAGLFSYLPLTKRLQDKISIVLLEEMKACGNQKLSMPVVNPADV